MEKANIAPFYVGQKVVYITGVNMPKDSVHTVTDVKQSTCGCWTIAIGCNTYGLKLYPETAGHNEIFSPCQMCGKMHSGFSFNGWMSSSFRPHQQQNFPLIKLIEIRIKETEKVEPILIGEN